MLEDLLPFYERELSVLRGLAAEFAEQYPKVARRLGIDHDSCDDPQVERLLESFAWFGARIHQRLDDEVPEIAEAVIQMLGPQWLRPLPSATILQLLPDPRKTPLLDRYPVPRHSRVLSPAVQGTRCLFRTCHGVDLWPLTVARACLQPVQASVALPRQGLGPACLTLDLVEAPTAPGSAANVDRLRFYLDGEPALRNLVYDLLCFRLQGVMIARGLEAPGPGSLLPAASVTPAGFAADEALYDPDPRVPSGHRLLFEYFAFPDKFRFLEVAGLKGRLGPWTRLHFLLPRDTGADRALRLLERVSAGTFKLGCVPAVNLFAQRGAAIQLSGQGPDPGHPVTAEAMPAAQHEVYAIDAVRLTFPASRFRPALPVPAFYGLGRAAQKKDPGCAWHATRTRSLAEEDPGTDVALTLVDPDFQPFPAPAATLELELTCSNRNLPEAIPWNGGELEEDEPAFLLAEHPLAERLRALRPPTPSQGPPARPDRLWRIIAHLCLDHLGLASLDADALRDMLELFPGAHTAAMARQIQGIAQVATRPVTTVITVDGQRHAARGLEVALTLDEDCYAGGDLLLFAAVLERFFGQLSPENGFVQLRALSRQRGCELAAWRPRYRDAILD
jgi:type VI secretion system protein ImpG